MSASPDHDGGKAMTHFINPDEFPNDDELLEHIIDNVVFPSLSEQVGPEEMEHVQGIAYVFGGRNDVDPAIIGKLYALVETEGVPQNMPCANSPPCKSVKCAMPAVAACKSITWNYPPWLRTSTK